MLHSLRKPIVLVASLAFFLFIGEGSVMANGEPQIVKPKVVVKKKVVKKHHRTRTVTTTTTRTTTKRTVTKNVVKPVVVPKNYPPPGSSGEDRNMDWMRKRAFPNDYLDPSYYPNALEEARKLPVYRPAGKQLPQAAMQWESIGPFGIGGRVTAIATHPTDSNIFYVGAAAGGLWKTIDHGNTWTALTDTFASLPVGCVTLDPHDPETIYLGMGECNGSADSYPGNGLWRSVNGGLTWQYLGLAKTQYIAKIIVDPLDKNIIYVCSPGPSASADSNRGIWKSVDHGATWRRMLLVRAGASRTSTPVAAIDLVMNPQDNKDLVAAMWQKVTSAGTSVNVPYNGLWRTQDSGATWNRIDTITNSGYPNGVKIKRLARTSLLWAVNNKGVATLYSVVSKMDKNPVTGYVLDENFYGLFSTTNPDNIPWQIKLDSTYRIPFLGNNIDSVDLFNKQGGYDNFIVGHPTHADEIYIGGIDMIRSTDGGTSWTNITKAYPHYFANDRTQHSDMHAMAFTAAKNGDDLLNGQDGGVFNTRNFGASWTQLRGLPITMFYHLETWPAGMTGLGNTFPATAIKLTGGTQDNGTVAHGFSSNSDWDWINRGDGGQSQTDPNNKDHLITSLQLGKVFFRTSLDSLRPNLFSDAGNLDPNAKKWFDLSVIAKRRGITDSSEACAFIPPVVLDKKRGNELYTARTKVYRAKLDFADPDSGTVIVPWSPQIGGTNNNPKAWYTGTVDCIALGPRDENGRPMIWAGGLFNGGTSLYRTLYDPTIHQDTAPKWTKIITGLPPAYVEVIVCDRSDSMIAFCGLTGTQSTKHVYKTINGGKNWVSISGNLPNVGINGIVIDSLAETSDPLTKNQCIIVATDVGVFVTTDGGRTWAQLGTGMPHVVIETITMYKNWLIAGTHARSAWALDVSSLQALPLSVSEKQRAEDQFAISSIYPSPLDLNSHSVLRVRTEKITDAKISVEIMNASTGASVFQTRSQIVGGEVELQMPKTISAGSYLIRIITSDGKSAAGQVVVVK